jgi:AAA15 family ATPase/GTPase
MQLIYLWIKNFRGFKKQGFNFSIINMFKGLNND